MKKILILVPHPDDEVLSFGGLISKAVKNGDHVRVVLFTCGGPCSNVPSTVRREEFENVMKFLNVTDYSILGSNKDGLLSCMNSTDLTGIIDNEIRSLEPDEVYCAPSSEHADHKALAQAFLGAARLKSGFMPKLFAFGTYMFTDQLYSNQDGGKIFQPLTEEDYKLKLEAFKLHESQFKPDPSPLGERGLRVWSEYLGLMCGSQYAEMYYQLRYIRCY